MGVLEQFDFEPEDTEYYPGSKKPIIRHPNRKVDGPKDPLLWDSRPRILPVGGVEKEFFTIGQLAMAMGGRKPVTIRKWERTGIIPLPTFRKPSKLDDPRGQRRLYSRAQVEGMIKIAEEEGVLYAHAKPITQTDFTKRVIDLFKRLAEEE